MEFNNDQPIYIQIADHFCEQILLKNWLPQDRIPSVREIAAQIEVNPNTVMRTFNFLQEKAIIFNKRGIGYFVSGDGYDKTLELKKQDFINHELPKIFKAMDLLEVSVDDIKDLFEKYKRAH